MKTYACLAGLALSLLAGAPMANAQVLVAQPYETLIIQPNARVIREQPLFAVTTGQPLQIIMVERVIRPAAHPVAHHRLVATQKSQDRVAADYHGPLYNTVAAPTVHAPVTTQVVQAVTTPVVGQGLSGQFQCVQGCAGGVAGTTFVTQNGWDLNLVNEIGQPSRAWIDYPGHIWVRNWDEGAVYSPDGMTIQFDNGAVWSKSILLVMPPLR
jgi:hypothetical protein